MDRRYRWFAYFLGVLLLGSILLDWLSGSIRVPGPSPADNAPTSQLPPAEIAAPPEVSPVPSDMAAARPRSYAPSYDNSSFSADETSKVREAPPSDQPSPSPMANSSDLQPPAPPPTAAPEDQDASDRDQITTSPKSSNAALREKLKSKGH